MCVDALFAYAPEQAEEERQGGESGGGHAEADDQQLHAYQLVTQRAVKPRPSGGECQIGESREWQRRNAAKRS